MNDIIETPRPETVAEAVSALEHAGAEAQVLVGFDGFIDQIVQMVDRRHDKDRFDPIPTIAAFGDRIIAAAGLSANFEMVPQRVKLGGNGPIMANALLAQGYATHYIGALGEGSIHPVFRDFAADECESVVSLAAPAHTDALEFEDGKLMLGKMSSLDNVRWDTLLSQMGEGALRRLLERVSLIACTNWTMLPYMNSILEGIESFLAESGHRLTIFCDLADPAKRSPEDIRVVLGLLSRMQALADVVLGLNENESIRIHEVLLGRSENSLTARAAAIRTELSLSMVLVHPVTSAAVSCAEGEFFIRGPYCQKPRLTTGAGDNFNAGFCVGLLSGVHPAGCLATGVCNSGFYVRNMRSASRAELLDFMRHWYEAGCPEVY